MRAFADVNRLDGMMGHYALDRQIGPLCVPAS